MFDGASRGRRTLAAVLLAAATASPHPLRAQSSAQIKGRLLAAARHSATLRDSVKLLHEMRATDLPADSFSIGGLRFRFSSSNLRADLQANLRTAAEHSVVSADSVFGTELQNVLGATSILATRLNTPGGAIARADFVSLELVNGGGRSINVRSPLTARKLEDGILDLVGSMATQRVPANVLQWGGAWVPSRRAPGDLWESAAVDLASSNSIAAKSCYSGSVPACESALGLTDVRDPLREWYSPEGWRVLVSTWRPSKDSVAMLSDREECLEKRVTATCERLARLRPVPIPLTISTRQTLFGLAIALGGRSAYSRLIHATGTPLEVLVATAGTPADSLILAWRARVGAAAPKSASPSPLEATVAVAWVLMFGLIATRKRP